VPVTDLRWGFYFAESGRNNFLNRLEKEIEKVKPKALIAIANSSDPYLGMEEKLKLTRHALKILVDYDIRLMLITKSTLILRDSDILTKFKKIVVSFTLTTLEENLAKRLEPYAPSPIARLTAMEKLARRISVVCRLDPLIYPLNTNKIKETIKELKQRGVKQIITSTYKAKPDNLRRMIKAFPEYEKLWQKLYLKQKNHISRCIYLPIKLRKKLIEEVRQVSLSEKLEFSSCREGFNDLNTKICDGSSFL